MKLLNRKELHPFYLEKIDQYYEGKPYYWDQISETALIRMLEYLINKKKQND